MRHKSCRKTYHMHESSNMISSSGTVKICLTVIFWQLLHITIILFAENVSEIKNIFSNEIFNSFSIKISGNPVAKNKVTSKIKSWQVKRSSQYYKIERIWLIWLHRRIFTGIGRSETKGEYSKNSFLSRNIHFWTNSTG